MATCLLNVRLWFEDFQDLALCSRLLIIIMKTTFLTCIPIYLFNLIPHRQSGNLSVYLPTGNFNRLYFKDTLKLGIHVIFFVKLLT